MGTRQQSWRKLRRMPWASNRKFLERLRRAKSTIQPVTKGSGAYLYDEYSILVTRMPPGVTAEAFLLEMLGDLNKAVNDGQFTSINEFKRKRKGAPQVGEVIEIDILGPDDGSVALAEVASDHFIFQTVETPAQGSHPEYGAREFGFQRVSGTVGYDGPRHSAVLKVKNAIRFYTRGVSRPNDAVTGWIGSDIQHRSWTRLVIGIGNQLMLRGGSAVRNSIACVKSSRNN